MMSNTEGDGSHELVRLMTGYADLKLTGERLNSVAHLIGAIRREQAELREIPQTLESHVIFDPRWD
jgi:hypothetical protein